MDFKKHCRLVFELYVEAHDDPNITTKCPQGLMNELHSDPPEISKGKIRFFLTLGRVLKEKKITLVVGTDRIINIVDGWGGGSRREQYWETNKYTQQEQGKFLLGK